MDVLLETLGGANRFSYKALGIGSNLNSVESVGILFAILSNLEV